MEQLVKAAPADYGYISGLVGALCARYPCLSAAPMGRSVLGRSIWDITVGMGKQRVLMAAAFHAQEWITSLVCLRLCEDIAAALHTGKEWNGWRMARAMEGRSLVFVPLVNPDGVQIALHGADSTGEYAERIHALGGDTVGLWQANANGVDLNHNFNAGWEQLQQQEQKNGIVGPCARRFGGFSPESEPETRALTALCRRGDFRHAVALHSQGEEIYWRYGEHTPPASRLMAMVMASASGYRLADPEGLASHGGFKDWFIEELHRPAFTIELGKGENPLPLTEFDELYAKAREMLLLSLMM